jgi:hypothetical protein
MENPVMAWACETLQPIEARKPPVDERFADLLRQVASGQKSKEQAWAEWTVIRQRDSQNPAIPHCHATTLS